MTTRRRLLSHAASLTALLALPQVARAAYNTGAFEAKTLADAIKALGASPPTESKDVSLTAPDIAENGAVVPLAVASNLPGVRRLLLLVEKNPAVLSAVFEVSDAVEPSFATRVKMGQTSNVFAVALMADGRALFAQKEVKVTLGGCGG